MLMQLPVVQFLPSRRQDVGGSPEMRKVGRATAKLDQVARVIIVDLAKQKGRHMGAVPRNGIGLLLDELIDAQELV